MKGTETREEQKVEDSLHSRHAMYVYCPSCQQVIFGIRSQDPLGVSLCGVVHLKPHMSPASVDHPPADLCEACLTIARREADTHVKLNPGCEWRRV